jgi:hypothetical protein
MACASRQKCVVVETEPCDGELGIRRLLGRSLVVRQIDELVVGKAWIHRDIKQTPNA